MGSRIIGVLALQADGILDTPEGIVSNVSLSGHLGELASFIVDDQTAREMTGSGSFKGTVCVTDTGYRYAGDVQINNAVCNGVAL